MAHRCRPGTSQEDLLAFHKAHHPIILELVREPAGHLPGEERVVLQTIEEIVTRVALGDKPGHFRGDLAQLDAFGAAMRTAKEDQTTGIVANGRVLGVFVGIQQSLCID